MSNDKSDKEVEENAHRQLLEDGLDPATTDWSKISIVRSRSKIAVSLRIDADVVDWFRSKGPGYQSYMNDVLKAYVEHTKDAKQNAT